MRIERGRGAAEIQERIRLVVEDVEDAGEVRDPQHASHAWTRTQQLELPAAAGHVPDPQRVSPGSVHTG